MSTDEKATNIQDEGLQSFRSKEFKENSIPFALQRKIGRLKNATAQVEVFDRLKVENEIRQFKRLGHRCPFERNGLCANIRIRCGERQQYNAPETPKQRELPHQCFYKPGPEISEFRILLVTTEPETRDACLQFMRRAGIRDANVETAISPEEAEALLNLAKILGRPFHLVLSDAIMLWGSGFQLVNHLVERNYNSRVVLRDNAPDVAAPPEDYLGETEVLPGRKVVQHTMKKDLAYEDFARTLEEVKRDMRPL